MELILDWIRRVAVFIAASMPTDTMLAFDFNVYGFTAMMLVCLVCGAVGCLVVGNRMAFFSDALAHCAFAGIALGVIVNFWLGVQDAAVVRQHITLILVAFGLIVGLLIAYVRESTGLASDTVIGVFFAGAIGLGALFSGLYNDRRIFNIENFIFGDATQAREWDVFVLLLLGLGTMVFFSYFFNSILLASANPSLAQSRRIRVSMCHYTFVALLALLVNLTLQIAGVLLINGIMIVPAATAANMSRNVRQMFWFALLISVLTGCLGFVLSWEVAVRTEYAVRLPTSSAILVLGVVFFILSMFVGKRIKNRDVSAS